MTTAQACKFKPFNHYHKEIMKFIKPLIIAGILFPAITLNTSCSSDDPEPEKKPAVTPDPEPEPEPEPGRDLTAEQKAVYDYFTASLKGETPAAPESSAFDAADYDKKKTDVWTLWKWAVEDSGESALPNPSPLSFDVDFMSAGASGSWMLGKDHMQYFYAVKGSIPAAGAPLTIYLHGSGDNEPEWRYSYGWCASYNDSPMAYFIPRSPAGGTGCRWYQPSRQQVWEQVFRQAYLSGKINPNKIYFAGVSEGGYGSQRLASFYADYLAGAGPIAGGEQLFNCPPENCANIAFCLQTGALDTMYGRSRLTQKAKEEWTRLQQEHPELYKHKIDLQPNQGHGCDYSVTTPWLKNHTRNPYPKYVYWENYAMGGVNGEGVECRSGFYNLQVLEAQIGKNGGMTRDCYEMTDRKSVV